MECSAKVFAKGDPEKLYECLAAEDTNFERSSFIVKKTKDGVEFDVKAKDAVALRATLNSIAQLLIIFEGARKPKQNV